jgi:hypothetical protein
MPTCVYVFHIHAARRAAHNVCETGASFIVPHFPPRCLNLSTCEGVSLLLRSKSSQRANIRHDDPNAPRFPHPVSK